MTTLIIMESPTKAATVKGYLGSGYRVVASKGHVRDLPKSTLGVDIEHDFKPKYINIRGKGELINDLRRQVKEADRVLLATDPDREGEAIAWHLSVTLGIPMDGKQRVTFNEITKKVVKDAVKHPRELDMGLVNAQQCRRILDRIVGYKLSPFLWSTVRSGLSAGRVQSVATRIIVDREEEIRAFVPQEYWTVDAHLKTPDGEEVKARFFGDKDGKLPLSCEEDARRVAKESLAAGFTVSEVRHTTKQKSPSPPFTTSTLQQEASRKLNFQSTRTMRAAQELYEGVDLGPEFGGVQGLITYMRTDSVRVSEEAQGEALAFIGGKYGDRYVPETPRKYRTKAGAQDAHEAIRPANVNIEPSKIRRMLSVDQYRLYRLIWNRYVASQMASAEIAAVNVSFDAGRYVYRASGSTVKFPGFLAVYEESTDDANDEGDERTLPPMSEGDRMGVDDVVPEQHYTEPPARYTEASLIKYLEELGIGRPSTFPMIVPTITQRGYVDRSGKSLCPTPLGETTTKLMKESFPDIVDCQFTATMETRLDEIEEGGLTMEEVLGDFYSGFSKELEAAGKNAVRAEVPPEETDLICEKCGAKMIVKNGRYGKFAACPNYPECKNTKPLNKRETTPAVEEAAAAAADMKCELCGGDMVLRHGRYGNFYACTNYPKCKFTRPFGQKIDVKCPKCGSDILTKWGRNKSMFYSCVRYPECDFSSWDRPTNELCPKCGAMLYHKKGKPYLFCKTEGCGYKRDAEDAEDAGK